jgi:hypothetical protein
LDYQSGLDEFDEHDLHSDESGLQLVAKKNFNMSIFDEIDLVGLNENEETFTVRYEIDYIAADDAVLMTVIIEGNDEIPVLETIPGLVAHNAAGNLDVMFVIDDEFVWLSDMYASGLLDEVGFFSALASLVNAAINTVVNAAVAVATAVAQVIVPIVAPAVLAGYHVICLLGGGELATKIGAAFLDMTPDTLGNYHAGVDCWQQYFGYIDLYDIVFGLTTSMDNRKFPFDTNGDGVYDYTLWAWKGDYINLGAGAELGIYKRWVYGNEIWIVDKSIAMMMTLKLDYKGTNIIDWQPTDKQWWITGFNPNKPNVLASELTATYTVTFTNTVMYNAFKAKSNIPGNGWTFNGTMTPTYVL